MHGPALLEHAHVLHREGGEGGEAPAESHGEQQEQRAFPAAAGEDADEEIDYLVHCLNPFDIREVQHVSGYDILRMHRSVKIRLFVGKAAKWIAGYFLHPTK